MNKFSYLTPKSIKEAIFMYYSQLNSNPIYLAGGTDAIIKIKQGLIKPKCIISLKQILKQNTIKINKKTGDLTIGALTTHTEIKNSEIIKEKYKMLYDAVKNIGSVQIRNTATIGGNIVNAAPSSDTAIPLIALDSTLKLINKNKERNINLIDFFLSPGKTILKPGEILKEITIPKLLPNTSGAYKKFTRRSAMELPIVSIAVVLSLEKKTKICNKVRISLGVAAPTPIRAKKAEKYLKNNIISEKTLNKAGSIAANESKVRTTMRGEAWFRKKIISVYVKRMGNLAINRLKNKN